jgi:AraC-like DNA-binding protein
MAEDLCRRLNGRGAEDAPFRRCLSLACLVRILVLVNKAFRKKPPAPRLKPHLEPRLRRVADYIETHLGGRLSLDTLAGEAAMSKYYLCREFKAVTGRSLHQYIITKRIARAKSLLAEGATVESACLSAGFTDYPGFVRLFKKFTGLTPVRFRSLPRFPGS